MMSKKRKTGNEEHRDVNSHQNQSNILHEEGKSSGDLNLKVPKAVTLEDKDVEKWRKLSRQYFNSIKKILKFRDPSISAKKIQDKEKIEKVIIKLPSKFNIQRFFEERDKESVPATSTFLFRDFNVEGREKAHAPKNFYSYKLFLDWDVQFDAVIKGKNNRKIRLVDEGDTLQAIDVGGPTSQFISDFCKQLGDLYVMLPIGTDVLKINVSRYKLEKKDFLQPERGYKVLYQGRRATIKKYHSRNNDELDSAELSFDYKEEKPVEVERKDFEVIEVAIPLFDQQSSGFVPQRDDYFMNAHDKAKRYSPKIVSTEVEDKAKLYYRAVGRFMLHVMSDGRNPIPSTTMPDFFRNVLLRNCLPGTPDYPDDLVLLHLSKLEIDGLKNFECLFGLEFEVMDIEKEGIITKENFISDFIPGYVIQSRSNNLKALRDGLTLEGEFSIDDILGCQPLEAVSKQFFSQPTLFVQDIVALLRPCYEHRIPDSISRGNHETFLRKTLPEALNINVMKQNNSLFLADFVFCITGSRCIPYFDGNPDFELNITFDKSSNSLPTCHTSEHLLHVPWDVYNNNSQILAQKLEKLVEYALVAGFDMG